jgi:hypothetical protein
VTVISESITDCGAKIRSLITGKITEKSTEPSKNKRLILKKVSFRKNNT